MFNLALLLILIERWSAYQKNFIDPSFDWTEILRSDGIFDAIMTSFWRHYDIIFRKFCFLPLWRHFLSKLFEILHEDSWDQELSELCQQFFFYLFKQLKNAAFWKFCSPNCSEFTGIDIGRVWTGQCWYENFSRPTDIWDKNVIIKTKINTFVNKLDLDKKLLYHEKHYMKKSYKY